MLMPFNQIQAVPQKVDICFYDAYISQAGNYKCEITFFIVRGLITGWFLLSHLLNMDTEDQSIYNLITTLFLVMITFNIVNALFSFWTLKNVIMDSKTINQFADRLQHSQYLDDSNINQAQTYYQPNALMNLKVSKTVYQFQTNLLVNEVDEEYKKRAQRQCQSLISQSIGLVQGIKCFTQFLNVCSICLFTYTIVLMTEPNGVTNKQFIFLCTYLFSQFLSRLFIYLIITIIGLSPIFCLCCCIWALFCKKSKNIQLPAVKDATLDIVNECEGNCPICYQNVNLEEKVIVLKCSSKHVFHELCIKGWTSLGKDTCPVCRSQI